MNTKVMELLNNQKEARNVLALEIVKEAKESLIALGCENLLNETNTVVETIEVIKEVEIEKIIEVPVEVVKDNDSDKELIKSLTAKLEEQVKINEVNAASINRANETIDRLKAELKAKEEMYKNIIAELNNKLATTKTVEETKKNTTVINTEEVKGLKITKKTDTHVIGYFDGVPFSASKNMDATMVFNPDKWDLKEQIDKALVDAKFMNPIRLKKDDCRVECVLGACHEISPSKYEGYVIVDNKIHVFVYNDNYDVNNSKSGKKYATTQPLDRYLKNPGKFYPCQNRLVNAAIKSLLEQHRTNANDMINDVADIIGDIFTADSFNTVDNTEINFNTVADTTETTIVNTNFTVANDPNTIADLSFDDCSNTKEEEDALLNFGIDDAWNC